MVQHASRAVTSAERNYSQYVKPDEDCVIAVVSLEVGRLRNIQRSTAQFQPSSKRHGERSGSQQGLRLHSAGKEKGSVEHSGPLDGEYYLLVVDSFRKKAGDCADKSHHSCSNNQDPS